jgi:hypothetical protein
VAFRPAVRLASLRHVASRFVSPKTDGAKRKALNSAGAIHYLGTAWRMVCN